MYLGIDASLNSFGVAILDSNKGIIWTDVIKPLKLKTQEDKIKNIQNYLTNLLKDYPITEAILEDVYFSRNPVTTKLLARISGVVIAVLNLYSIPYRFITTCTAKAHTLKKEIEQPKRKRGQPKEPKIDFKEEVRLKYIKLYNLHPDTLNDITDAIMLSYIGIDGIYDIKKPKKGKKK